MNPEPDEPTEISAGDKIDLQCVYIRMGLPSQLLLRLLVKVVTRL